MTHPGANASETPPAAEGWSRRTLVVCGVVLFVLQVGLVLATGTRLGKMPVAPVKGPSVRWIQAAVSPVALATFFGVADPAGAVLPGPHGFSAEGWLRLPTLPQVRIGWVDATHWLVLRTNTLGRAYAMLPQERRPLLAASEPPELPGLLQPPALPPLSPLRTASSAALEAGLADRVEGPFPAIPTLTNGDVLKDTVVKITLDAEGRVLAARLVERSGLAEADQLAVTTALNLPFRPRAGAGPVSGQLRIQWNTLPPTGAAHP